MEAIEFLDTIINDWKLLVVAFTIGGFYYQAKQSAKKILDALENSGAVHGVQNTHLQSINTKLESLDSRMARIEDTVETVKNENQSQSIRLAVLETQTNNIIEHPARRRVRRSQ